MQEFEMRLLVENSFDTVNRVLNKFCGKGFEIKHLEVRETHENSVSELKLSVNADRHLLEILSRKLMNFVDVYKLVNLSEIKHLSVV